ncbi:unnamed protein product [Symbiodinium natans]|uniref:Uncharacterized protein n=1 Tax=Symbiodinium natans TaxID=878477 RepID=A0A812S457_9DINO|nr:unnamed protein product [Symbiodinium natans]
MRSLVLHVGVWSALLVGALSASSSDARASIIRSHEAVFSRLMNWQPSEGGDSEETTGAPTREIDQLGRCVIPMWNSRDFVCQEHIDVSGFNIFEDYRGRVRKRLEDGQLCTVQCPDPRWWQIPWDDEQILCTRGVLKTHAGAIVQKIDCRTASSFKFSVLVLVLIAVLGPVLALRSAAKPAPPLPGPTAQPIQIVDEPDSPTQATAGSG